MHSRLPKKIEGLLNALKCGCNVPRFTFINDYEDYGINIHDILLGSQSARMKINRLIDKSLQDIDLDVARGVSVRSASTDEDSLTKSNAGKYISFNGLCSIGDICSAILGIWKDHREKSFQDSSCYIILQETHVSYFSGVAFYSRRGEYSKLTMESYFGSCRTVVSGLSLPYRSQYTSDKGWKHYLSYSGDCVRYVANRKLFLIESESPKPGELLKALPSIFPEANRLFQPILSDEIVVYGYRPDIENGWYQIICDKVLNNARKLMKDVDLDIEWGINSGDDEISIYQARPITSELDIALDTSPSIESFEDENRVIRGIPGSSGRAIGAIYTSNNKKTYGHGVLLLYEAAVEDMEIIKRSKGVISVMGGVLSHVSTVCREYGIPCVVGIGRSIPEGTKVEIEGDTGIIRIL